MAGTILDARQLFVKAHIPAVPPAGALTIGPLLPMMARMSGVVVRREFGSAPGLFEAAA